MKSPGMSMVLADREGALRVATYGFSDVDRRLSVRPEHLFQIGSISRSFTAILVGKTNGTRKSKETQL